MYPEKVKRKDRIEPWCTPFKLRNTIITCMEKIREIYKKSQRKRIYIWRVLAICAQCGLTAGRACLLYLVCWDQERAQAQGTTSFKQRPRICLSVPSCSLLRWATDATLCTMAFMGNFCPKSIWDKSQFQVPQSKKSLKIQALLLCHFLNLIKH